MNIGVRVLSKRLNAVVSESKKAEKLSDAYIYIACYIEKKKEQKIYNYLKGR